MSAWEPDSLTGTLRRGRGLAAGFLGAPAVRDALVRHGGFAPWPGTVNLHLDDHGADRLDAAFTDQGSLLPAPRPGQCTARLLPLRLASRHYACALRPDVPGYAAGLLEILSPLPLRERLALREGGTLAWQLPVRLQPRAVVFDLDGTLVDSLAAYQAIADQAAAAHGLRVPPELVRQALNLHPRNFWEDVVPAQQPDRARVMQDLHAIAMRISGDILTAQARLFDAATELVQACAAAGLKLGVVTSSGGQGMRALADAGLAAHFEHVVTAHDRIARKPAPDGILACAAALGLAPEAVLYVGDAIVDVQAARGAGASVAAVACGAGSAAELATEGVDRLAADPAGLLALLRNEGVLA